MMQPNKQPPKGAYLAALAVGALGIVYGDIGTSPLYALRECFSAAHGAEPTRDNILGVLSLMFWSLTSIVSFKYLALVMKADNKGEGGILALLALLGSNHGKEGSMRPALIFIGLFGGALLYGDGMITPAISVLSAVEGLEVATPMFKPWIIPITILILITLFTMQRHGSGSMGRIFGPIMLAWFLTIGILGVRGVMGAPEVLAAVNPWHAVHFLFANGWIAFVVLGAVVLSVTGAEALYADMGHFGRQPIRLAWFLLVFPCLLLNYFGQGARLLNDPLAVKNPFFMLAPSWALYPLVALATTATVIASQALISGAFSLTMQAMQLGYCPRMKIDHTSEEERGQIYMPEINWVLLAACIALVAGFGSSSRLAGAYGVAVTLTMATTTVLLFFAARDLWHWSTTKAALVCAPLLALELAFFGANCLKILHGGWFPLIVGAIVFTLLTTWKKGRQILGQRLRASSLPLDLFMADVRENQPLRVRGSAVFMSGNPQGTPLALLHNLKHNKILHEKIILLTLLTVDEPYVEEAERATVEQLDLGFYRVVARYGFMEEASVPKLLKRCKEAGVPTDYKDTTFFLSRETILTKKSQHMARWRKRLFALMSRNAQGATAYFRLPANRVVELGMQVEL